MFLESPSGWSEYELIDSGNFEKLERFGKYILIRPEPKALWDKHLSEKEWLSSAHTRFSAGAGFSASGKEDPGTWKMLKKMDEQWIIPYKKGKLSINLRLGLTSFKHVGVFPEQAPNWDYIFSKTKMIAQNGQSAKNDQPSQKGQFTQKGMGEDSKKPKILNLFAYTGAASLAAKQAGADVVHLDSVKQVVNWARVNMELSRLDGIRWIIEDALKFVNREARRGNLYQGIILDPPAYGHGPEGERWKLDEHLYEMLKAVSKILSPANSFLVLNLYSNGYSAVLAETLVREAFLTGKERSGTKIPGCGELVLKDSFGRSLPLSVFVRLER
ncbi:MAG: class I SAM-dependent methyltransferase [Bacteroidales bacterium]|nr:class I SAM-dependent methyltransferase [Bacteroidales bacterium]MDD2424388.1 class I SAM-dependent methyltransferase [Bacteroidales bacterium]MDD3988970.1 class I SAM-dependent methyltransferase [Bacteroidales bacterium]MDD4639452.1 class I SAM-dependent methyltransferase [Bacteroidales bacterium]